MAMLTDGTSVVIKWSGETGKVIKSWTAACSGATEYRVMFDGGISGTYRLYELEVSLDSAPTRADT